MSGFGRDDKHHGGRGGHGGPHHGGRGGLRDAFGGPGGLGGFDGVGRGGGRLGRLFGGGDLKLLVLSLIEQQPRHGYDVIRQIEEMFGGQYSPSPGAIYPTLTLLDEQGLVSVTEVGGKKLHTLTPAGAELLARESSALSALKSRLNAIARSLSTQLVPETVRLAMGAIKQELIAHHRAWDDTEAQRVGEILRKAADAIAERTP